MSRKPKPKFKAGQTVILRMRVLKRDARTRPPRYKLQALPAGWVFDDFVFEDELRRESHEKGD
jgi:ADP-ribose pyrophosphatase YjhB (NUDIX family)